ncbi:MAG TPA: hypothetical protein VKD72_05170, partial [Gemmataceae bacterium]|nr:hypothetical protein [Gemmataceae bacterium]
ERFADGRATEAERAAAWQAVFDLSRTQLLAAERQHWLMMATSAVTKALGRGCVIHFQEAEGWYGSASTAAYAARAARVLQDLPGDQFHIITESVAWDEESAHVSGLVRCLFGNPFRRPPAPDRWAAWATPPVTAMARAVYDGHDFGRVRELARGLQAAGCDDAAALQHLHGPDPHARGCWVIDAILALRGQAGTPAGGCDPPPRIAVPHVLRDYKRPRDITTAAEWEASGDGLRMAGTERTWWRPRKMALVAAACCRRFLDRPPEAQPPAIRPYREAIIRTPPRVTAEDVERFADGQPSPFDAVRDRFGPAVTNGPLGFVLVTAGPIGDPELRIMAALEEGKLADIYREVFGNPFLEAQLGPAGRPPYDGPAARLALEMYEARDFGQTLALAELLEAAGCTDAWVLGHLRGPGPHVRGCWVVDLILDKD